jgi:lipoyl(octanoyl) transferase
MPQRWRFINTGSCDPAYNMALDEAMLLHHDAGGTLPTLRVYGWTTPTLSLGYAQKTWQEVNLAACQQSGVSVVRRPTGGRAVLHDCEVTYSVVLPTAQSLGPATLTAHYRRIGLALAAALQRLGLAVHLERPRLSAQPRRAAASPACFAAIARYELSAAGKKIVGSAQKRLQHTLLQHGSMPLHMERQRLFQCLQVPLEQRDALVQEAFMTMTAINEIAPSPVTAHMLHEALREGFGGVFGVEIVDSPLFPTEERLADELYTTKYTNPVWNLEGATAWRQSVVLTHGT